MTRNDNAVTPAPNDSPQRRNTLVTMLDEDVCFELIAEALDVADRGLIVVRQGRVHLLNRMARSLLEHSACPDLVGRTLDEVLAEPLAMDRKHVELWLSRSRSARLPLCWTEKTPGKRHGAVEAELRSPFIARFPATDALLLRLVERPPLQARLVHDLANIMQGVASGVSLLASRADLDEPSFDLDLLGGLEDLSARATDLTRKLLAAPRRPTEGHLPPRDAGASLEATARALLGTRLSWNVPSPLPTIALSRDEWESVVLNLLFNARDASGPEGPIELRVEVVDGQLELTVRDEGVGMDSATCRRALEPGFTTKGPGTGMGLAHLVRMVGRVGGAVSLETAIGEGTTARVRLPIVS